MAKGSPALAMEVVKGLYRQPSSFTDLLPWVEYDPDSGCFLLEDGISVGALFELEAVGTEARTDKFMTELRDAIQTALNDAIPEEESAPWVLQVYVQDEPSLKRFVQSLREYPDERLRQTAFTRHQQIVMAEHLARISKPGGLFVDQAVTGSPWRGKRRAVRAVLYRRLPKGGKSPPLIEVHEALNDIAARWIAALSSAGITVHRGNGEDLYEWLLHWFNPAAAVAGGDPDQLLNIAPYPGDAAMPFGYEFAEQLTLSMPRSEQGVWWFDNIAHTVISVQGLRRAPHIGHLTAERRTGDHVVALFDRLPEHTVMAMTLTVKPQHLIRNQIAQVRRAAVGDSAEALLTREDADSVEREMAEDNKLYPLDMAFYVRGDDRKSLRANINQLNALLLANGLLPIGGEADLLAQDSYFRYLPMAYDPALDKRRRRSRLVFSRQVANLLPLYGRSRGTAHPGLTFFNRGAEPLVFDPLHSADRKKNAHMLILGPTGAGKSALLVYLLQQMLAVYRPRVFIIEAGASFSLLGQHLRFHGLSVNQVTLNPNADVSLPPFADAIQLQSNAAGNVFQGNPDAIEADDDDLEETTGVTSLAKWRLRRAS